MEITGTPIQLHNSAMHFILKTSTTTTNNNKNAVAINLIWKIMFCFREFHSIFLLLQHFYMYVRAFICLQHQIIIEEGEEKK